MADITDGTELVMSLLVHRHGDVTPVESGVVYSNNPKALKELSKPYGYGQLTKKGKQRAYELGEYIRTRYSELLAPEYNGSEVYIRSTDSTRTKKTILTALAAIYPPNDGWSDKLNWEPVPYTTVPVKYDFNLAPLNCPICKEGLAVLSSMPWQSLKQKYKKVFEVLSKEIGPDILQAPVQVYYVYNLYISQISLGLPVPPAVEAIWDEVVAAAGAAIDLVFGNETYIALESGVLLNEFHKYSAKAIAGEDTQRLRIYSAHDVTVFSFEAVTQITKKQGAPKYASAYSLELRKVTETGKYVVLPVYLPQPGQEVIYLQVKNCDQLCDYDQFIEITQAYSLDVDTWRTECGFTESTVIDDTLVQ